MRVARIFSISESISLGGQVGSLFLCAFTLYVLSCKSGLKLCSLPAAG